MYANIIINRITPKKTSIKLKVSASSDVAWNKKRITYNNVS